MFFVGEGGRFPGGAARDDGVGTVLNLPLNQFPILRIVDAAVSIHRGDNGHAGAGKNGLLTHTGSPHSKY